MTLKVLEENISRSMDCTIEFNGVVGFEVKEGLCQHKVDIARKTCSYVASFYRPTIEPLEITNKLGRPPKSRRKEAGETKKSGKFPRTGLAMTCSICHVRGHNKRECPQREGVESSTRHSAPSPTASVRAEPTGSGKGRGKPKKRKTKKTSSVAPSAPPIPTAPTDFPASSSAPLTYHASSSIAGTTKRGRGRGRGRGNTSPEKRPRVMGVGVFQAANGFKVMNVCLHMVLCWFNNIVLVMCFTNGVVLSMLKYEWMTRLLVVQLLGELLHINTSFIDTKIVTYIDNSN
ncbi:hypothetical protein MTR67_047442 [Solanum verrucosum]|uniref:Uncharacterized protein n=1 Tax=Solanum verrucosum TaxID=315347 RepID=A0AAF0UX38_SOLVR|nr:hypothetical protein MTR67_047442 [Solanum verrucosum]